MPRPERPRTTLRACFSASPRSRLESSIDGLADVGSSLTAYTGIWAGARVEATYAWERCRGAACEPVGTGKTYRVRPDDRGAALRVEVSAPGIASAVPASTVVPQRARNDATPTISGRHVVGVILSGSRGSWVGTTLSFSSRWIRCRAERCRGEVTVGRGLRYRVRAADRGHRLRLVVTATNRLGAVTARSAPTGRVR